MAYAQQPSPSHPAVVDSAPPRVPQPTTDFAGYMPNSGHHEAVAFESMTAPSSCCASSGCDHCCTSKCSCGRCLHRCGAFYEYLYQKPRGIDVYYGVPQDGIGGAGTVPVGEAGVVNYDYDYGYRAGVVVALDCTSSLTATYTFFETTASDAISVGAPNVIQPLVTHPNTFNVGFTAQDASAVDSIEYRFADLDYKAVWKQTHLYYINYVLGARYASLDQNFSAVFPFAPPDGPTAVATQIEFEGGGIRLGLEGERYLYCGSGLGVYGKAVGSLLGGRFQTDYMQVNEFNGVEALFASQEDRVVPIAEFEVGVRWTSQGGMVQWSGGYQFATWSNVVTTPEYINAVQQSTFVDISQDAHDTITFDGLVTRLQISL